VATNFAATNGVSIPLSDVNFNAATVTVTTPNPTPGFFSGVFGIHSAHPTAVAAARWDVGTNNSCPISAQNEGNCALLFARDSNCAHNSITLIKNGNATTNGGIWSNGSLYTDNKGVAHWGHTVYGTGCSWADHGNANNEHFASGPAQRPPINAWPRDYTTVIKCGGSAPYACTGPGGTPSFCTQVAADFTSLDLTLAANANQVFCATGTGASVSPSDPSTWTGNIIVPANSGSFNFTDSFIGGYVSVALHSAGTLSAQLSTSLGNLLIYANGTDSASTLSCPVTSPCSAVLQNSGGDAYVNGDVFVPNGTANVANSGNGVYTTFVQAQDVAVSASGGLTGDGPGGGPGSSPLPGADLLIQ
jgi:hypothetical protein